MPWYTADEHIYANPAVNGRTVARPAAVAGGNDSSDGRTSRQQDSYGQRCGDSQSDRNKYDRRSRKDRPPLHDRRLAGGIPEPAVARQDLAFQETKTENE